MSTAERIVSGAGVGVLTADASPSLLLLLADAEIDFLVLDAEQTGLGPRDCADVVQRLRGSAVEVGIRLPDLAPRTVLEFANTGAGELVLPQVRTVAELDAAYRATRYPPLGDRPAQVSFASSLGRNHRRVPRLSVLFETVDAVDAVADFVAADAFEGGWIGPTDLAADLRAHGRGDELDTAIDAVLRAVTAAGQPLGLPAGDVDGVPAAFARGASRCAVYWERQLGRLVDTLAAARPPSAEPHLQQGALS